MKLYLYISTAESNRVDKSNYLTTIGSLDGTLREECSVSNPSILIQADNLSNCNYAYIPEFNRYYFINDKIAVRTNLWRLEMTVDTLMSFKSSILQIQAFISRQQYNFDLYLPDDKLPSKISFDYKYKTLSSGYDYFYNLRQLSSSYYSTIPCVCVTTIGDNNNTTTPTIHYYLLTLEQLRDFQYTIMQPFPTGLSSIFQNPLDAIISVKLFPMNLKMVLQNSTGSGSDPYVAVDSMIVGNVSMPLLVKDTISVPSGDPATYNSLGKTFLTLGDNVDTYNQITGFNITNHFNDFRDYEPYTKRYLYIPYYGSIELDYQELKTANGLTLTMAIDLLSGSITYLLSKTVINNNITNTYVINTCKNDIAYDIPLNKTNMTDKIVQAGMSLIKTAIGLASTGISSAQNVAIPPKKYGKGREPKVRKNYQQYVETQNKLETTKNTINTVGDSITDIISIFRKDLDISMGGSGTIDSLYFSTQILLIDVIPVLPDNFNWEDYSYLVGRPAQGFYTLNNLHGYTECQGFHLDNIPNATSSELDDIDDALRSGIILPQSNNTQSDNTQSY